MNDQSIKIRKANVDDLDSVVKVHVISFPGFFLTKMGGRFLKEMYSAYVVHHSGVFFVALDDNKIVGFIAGTTSPDIFFAQLKRKRAFYFLMYSFPNLLRNPIFVFKKIFSAIYYRGDKPAELNNGTLLSSIGVIPDAQVKSVGKKLLKHFEDEAFSRGADFVYLTTDKLNNERVVQFYCNNGYIVESTFVQNKIRPMLRYFKKRV